MPTIHSKTSCAAVLALLLCAQSAAAQTLIQPTEPAPAGVAAKAPAKEKKLIYLTPDFLAHPGLILPAPPKLGSPEEQRDLAGAKAAQAAATPARIAQATADDENESVWAYGNVLPGFTAAKLPLTNTLFTAAQNDADIEADVFKNYFARKRPFEIDHTVKTCVPSVYGGKPRSYPSGHATLGYSLGVILTHLIPEKAEAIMARAKDYADSRVVCGVHFPSDLVASEVMGTAAGLEMMRNPAFKKAYDAAKAELIAAGFTTAEKIAAK